MTCHVADWLDKPVTNITEDKMVKRYTLIGETRGQTVANCVRRVLSAMLGYAMVAHKLFDKNPVRIIAETKSAYPEKRRDGHLKPHQLKPWYEAVNSLPNRTYRDYLLLVLFTGLRRTEALSLRWSQIDFSDKSLKIIQTKNGDPLTLPMSDFVYELLMQRRELVPGSLYVFPTSSGKGYLADPKKAIAAVSTASGVSFQLHDLRRSFASIASSLDISVYSIKAMLNHRSNSGDITSSYVIRDIERLREPMQKIATYMQEKMGAKA
ncbi:MAG: tyrosine-type recombinase/integrase [Alphaproteobacteria bacterium]|nr:tyrosine-type recombinase/integrase [Alphaproteobacteria bacterium]